MALVNVGPFLPVALANDLHVLDCNRSVLRNPKSWMDFPPSRQRLLRLPSTSRTRPGPTTLIHRRSAYLFSALVAMLDAGLPSSM